MKSFILWKMPWMTTYNVNYCTAYGICITFYPLGEDGQLYLVDWENVRIADPFSDLSRLSITGLATGPNG